MQLSLLSGNGDVPLRTVFEDNREIGQVRRKVCVVPAIYLPKMHNAAMRKDMPDIRLHTPAFKLLYSRPETAWLPVIIQSHGSRRAPCKHNS